MVALHAAGFEIFAKNLRGHAALCSVGEACSMQSMQLYLVVTARADVRIRLTRDRSKILICWMGKKISKST